MTKKTFFAQQWLQTKSESTADSSRLATPKENAECLIKNRFPSFVHRGHRPTLKNETQFSPVKCFTPGWKGESLVSKAAIKFEKLIKLVQADVKSEFLRNKDFPRSIKLSIHTEFLSFVETQGIHLDGAEELGKFWSLITQEQNEEYPYLKQFLDIYSNRIATIVFLKLRFIASLLDRCGIELSDKALLYPTSFLSQIFKKGSQFELNSRALESNLYSWYRPQGEMKQTMLLLMEVSKELAIAEIIKNVSGKTQISSEHSKLYSHALSSLSFGLFLNSLQINFPMWLQTIEGSPLPIGSLEQEEIISCKYFGDYLESLSVSHWLAQENNKNFKWDQILCPDFKGLEFISGTFSKLCNELQFLTFLVHKAEHQGEKPIEYICKIMGGHFRNKNASGAQINLLADNPFYTSTYDRVVLNLCQFPKNNPQHFLISKILDQVKYLKNNGFLFVVSSKKLFVPSLKDRLDPVLKELKVEAIFDFDNVKGKGELGSYIYIFRKRHLPTSQANTCSYFRISADLGNFQQFSAITEHLRSFYLAHLSDFPPMAQLEFSDSFRIEFYQDAIVNGMLINSTTEDTSRITHPSFFKSLMNNCVPFETLFDFQTLTTETLKSFQENALNIGLTKDHNYFLLIDFRSKEVKIELHPIDTFRSLHSDRGETLCSYFELHPKIKNLNPNLIRNFFSTSVGKQIINLTFSGGHNLVKGSLRKLLMPKFITDTESLPEYLSKTISLLNMSEEQLLEASPATIIKSFGHVDQVAQNMLPRYGCEILSRYSTFERALSAIIWKLDDSRIGQKISFNNPLIQSQLIQKKTYPLYPSNKDVFTEHAEGFKTTDLHLPMTQSTVKVVYEGDLRLFSLEIISKDKVILRLHAEEPMIYFIQFLLTHAINLPISKILKAIHVPSLEEIKLILSTTENMKTSYKDLHSRVESSITSIFRDQVMAKRP